jgi:hypothetical protein
MTDDFGSVENLVIARIVEEGTAKKAFQQGIARDDFKMYEEEWDWIIESMERSRTINWRRFQQVFPDFAKIVPKERLQDLCEELKRESAFTSLSGILETVALDLTPDNAVEKADQLREVIADVLRLHSPMSDVLLSSDWKHHIKDIKQLRLLREQGEAPGIPSGFKSIDHHWGGLIPGRVILALGRPGDAKSMTLAKMFISAFMDGRRVGVFSPEMNEHEHRCRIATLISALPEVQEELGLKKAFRNRALMFGENFNEKTYKRFWQYLDSLPGEIVLHTRKWHRMKMTPSFIEARIDELGLEAIFIDPIYKLKSTRKRMVKREEIEDLIEALEEISEAYTIPVIVSNQAHRQGGNFRGNAPGKDHSFNSDAPVQEADHVIGVKHFEDENKLRLWCSKNRFGSPFTADVKFFPNIGIIEDVTRIEGDYYNGHEEELSDELKKQLEKEGLAEEVET